MEQAPPKADNNGHQLAHKTLTCAALVPGCSEEKTTPFKFGWLSKVDMERALHRFKAALTQCTHESLLEVLDVKGASSLPLTEWCRHEGQVARVKVLEKVQGKMACCAHRFRLLFESDLIDYVDVFMRKRYGTVVAIDMVRHSTGRHIKHEARDNAERIDSGYITSVSLDDARLLAAVGEHQRALVLLSRRTLRFRC